MNGAREQTIAEQLNVIKEPFDSHEVSHALSRIAFAVLPDWGEFSVPGWLVEGLKPIFSRLAALSDELKVELLECVSLLYSSPSGVRPDFDLSELKAILPSLPVWALPYALLIIACEGAEGVERYLEPFTDHEHVDVRAEAREALGQLGHPA